MKSEDQCKGRVIHEGKWWWEKKSPGTTSHQCPFKAVEDGFCPRHHPIKMLQTLLDKREKLDKEIDEAQKAVQQLKPIKI